MKARKALLLALALCHQALAQGGTSAEHGAQPVPEEIVVTGERATLQLRLQLEEAERAAYELFNQFNDDRRFDISCSTNARTGSNFSGQSCQPEFEIQAMRAHARDYLESMPGRRIGLPDGSMAPTYSAIPMEAEIARHRSAFRARMQDVARQHPEFLEAIARYAALREQYTGRTGTLPGN